LDVKFFGRLLQVIGIIVDKGSDLDSVVHRG
jgi:hypothetical protein